MKKYDPVHILKQHDKGVHEKVEECIPVLKVMLLPSSKSQAFPFPLSPSPGPRNVELPLDTIEPDVICELLKRARADGLSMRLQFSAPRDKRFANNSDMEACIRVSGLGHFYIEVDRATYDELGGAGIPVDRINTSFTADAKYRLRFSHEDIENLSEAALYKLKAVVDSLEASKRSP